ncbi:MAG: DUF2493 domain-containing protein [Treponema sp.]|nr:DUF2493 domain-containing protein [Treponema sp.]
MKLFVCGSRTITDKEWIYSKIDECVSENNFTDITVLEGEAKGVDRIAKEWAVARGIPVKEYPPDVKHYLHNACHKRNEAMAVDCDFMLDLWDGESGGSLHDIMMAEKHQKPYKVCLYTTKLYSESVRFVLENRKEILRSSEDLRVVYPKFREEVFKHFMKDFMEPWWEEGYNSSSYFWVMPVRQGKEGDWGDWGCHCCCKEEISIEEDIVFDYLYHQFLHPHFDTSIEYTCREKNYGAECIEFDWWGYNLYKYETVRKIAKEMKEFSKMSFLTQEAKDFYQTLSDRLLLMMERAPDWDFITFEGP